MARETGKLISMTATELSLQEQINELKRLIVETRLPDEAIVDANYVAQLFGITPEAVIRKRFGTDKIRRVREKPVGFRKGDVHKVLKDLTRPAAEVAAEAIAKAKPRKRSIITKQVKR
jgi:hypothetical protein